MIKIQVMTPICMAMQQIDTLIMNFISIYIAMNITMENVII